MSQFLLPAAALTLGTLSLRAAGPFYLRGRPLSHRLESVVQLLPIPLLASLVVSQAFANGQAFSLDARAPALAAAGLLLLVRAPLPVVVVAGAAAAAAVRLFLGWG